MRTIVRAVLATWMLTALFVASPGGATAQGVVGAVCTTANPAVDGPQAACKGNPEARDCCVTYREEEHAWLNATGIGPDGYYFFAVLGPDGLLNPNDRGGVDDSNLSDDYDRYHNRTFRVTNGEVSEYFGTHDWDLPFIRLTPYSDTPNQGGMFILAVCYLDSGYPVDPASCRYSPFRIVRRGE